MIGILVILGISWVFLYIFERKDLRVLGIIPNSNRIIDIAIGFTIAGLLCAITQYIESLLRSSDWVLNAAINKEDIFKSFWWDFKSVFTEELIFRGALLYILIRKLNKNWGIVISAIAFGIYHWFTFGILGNIVAMTFVFAGTGLMGYAWATAFSKTKSMFLPTGLHLGWNLVHNSIFSKGPLGELLFIQQGGVELGPWSSFFSFLIGMVLVPILILLYVKFLVKESNVSE